MGNSKATEVFISDIVPGEIDIPTSWLKCSSDKYKVIKVKGNGYYPFILDGDILLVENENLEKLSDAIYLVKLSDKYELRKICLTDEEGIVLKGITPFISHIGFEGVPLMGKVVKLIRDY